MRTINYFEKELSIEEYIKKEVCKNNGTQSVAFKEQLIGLCEERGVLFDSKMKKSELFDVLIASGCEYKALAERFGVGVSSQVYQQTFNISHKEVKFLEKKGLLKKVGEYRFRAWGTYKYAPLYDIYQFASMTDEDMKKSLEEYPKGAKLKDTNVISEV